LGEAPARDVDGHAAPLLLVDAGTFTRARGALVTLP
jgi:hypothetical protein